MILRQAKRMSKLTSEMLMIAREEMNESYTMEEIDLGLLTELVIEELQEQSDQRKLR